MSVKLDISEPDTKLRFRVRFDSGEILDKAKGTAFNARVKRNQHRWRKSLDERTVAILDEFGSKLQSAWTSDSVDSKSYPQMSQLLFEEAKELLAAVETLNKTGKLPPLRLLVMEAKSLFASVDTTEYKPRKLPGLRDSPPPKKFADLLNERAIRAVYNDRHSDSYDIALKLANSGEGEATKAFHKLICAVESAYLIGIGFEFPAPRVHFLHRGLLDLAKLCGLDDLTNEGLEEFFKDLCPCGKKHNAEALRKLRQRVATRT